MSKLKMTYNGLAQAIVDSLEDDVRLNNNLSDGETYDESKIEQMIMEKASECTPSYLDHYDVASMAREMFDWDQVDSRYVS